MPAACGRLFRFEPSALGFLFQFVFLQEEWYSLNKMVPVFFCSENTCMAPEGAVLFRPVSDCSRSGLRTGQWLEPEVQRSGCIQRYER